MWKGEIEDAEEVVGNLQDHRRDPPIFETRLKELHPYETPEGVAFDPEQGLPTTRHGSQRRWARSSTEPRHRAAGEIT